VGKLSRTKGHNFEREIAALFRRWYPTAKRIRDCQKGSDIQGAGPFHVQCKRHKRVNIQKAYLQAMVDKDDSEYPMVVSKDDRSDILITMDWGTLCLLMDNNSSHELL